ncbi:MAG: ubiquinol-cytochrome c reductase iron-sulfur subunit [Betaproteobacteria bacterium]
MSDTRRRKLLVSATAALGGTGIAGAAVPFFASMLPSERAKAIGAPVETDVGTIEPGQLHTVEWRGKPVWIVHRTKEMLAALGKHDDDLVDPRSRQAQQPPCCRNAARSIKPEYFVAIGICTHLGCVPSYAPRPGAPELGADWHGGFYCPCHGSKFDLAGRVYKNVPAPSNLVVPPYQYVSDTQLLIGEETG